MSERVYHTSASPRLILSYRRRTGPFVGTRPPGPPGTSGPGATGDDGG